MSQVETPGTTTSPVKTPVASPVVAVYPDHASAEEAVKRLVKEGFAMRDVSIVGRDFQMVEEPIDSQQGRLRQGRGGDGGVGRRAVRPADRCGLPGPAGRRARDRRRPAVGGRPGGLEGALAGAAFAALPVPWSAGASPRTRRSSTRPRSRPGSSS